MATLQPIDLYAPHSPEQIARRLKTIMDAPMPDAKARVYGMGSEREIKLRYRQRNARTNMEPVLDAVMESYKGGTRITGTFGAPPGARYFRLIWVGFLSLFVIGGILAYIYIPGAGLFATIFAGIPLLMIFAGLAAFRNQPPLPETKRRFSSSSHAKSTHAPSRNGKSPTRACVSPPNRHIVSYTKQAGDAGWISAISID